MVQDIDNVLNLLAEQVKSIQGVKGVAENGLKLVHSMMDNQYLTDVQKAEIAKSKDEIVIKLQQLNDVNSNFK